MSIASVRDARLRLFLRLLAAVADVHASAELDTLGLHLRHAAIDQVLLHLEVGNAVPQQATNPVGALKNHDVVSGAVATHGDEASDGRSRPPETA